MNPFTTDDTLLFGAFTYISVYLWRCKHVFKIFYEFWDPRSNNMSTPICMGWLSQEFCCRVFFILAVEHYIFPSGSMAWQNHTFVGTLLVFFYLHVSRRVVWGRCDRTICFDHCVPWRPLPCCVKNSLTPDLPEHHSCITYQYEKCTDLYWEHNSVLICTGNIIQYFNTD